MNEVKLTYNIFQYVLEMYMRYRTKVEKKAGNGAPSRIIFYRDGVSEGQFRQVLDQGLYKIYLLWNIVTSLTFNLQNSWL